MQFTAQCRGKEQAMAKNNMENGYKYMYFITAAICVIITAIISMVLVFSNLFSDDGDVSADVSSITEASNYSLSQASAVNNVVSMDVSDYEEQVVQNSTLTEGMLSIITTTAPAKANLNLTDIYSHKSKIYGLSTVELYLNKEAIEALNDMMQGFTDAQGLKNVIVNDAYTELNAIKSKKSIASLTDLASGRTVRLTVHPQDQGTMGTGKHQWFAENSYQYGYILRYPADKTDKTGVDANASVFRYVGTVHAEYMNENKLCLEEYVELLKNYDYSNPLIYTVRDTGVQYWIYYQQAAVGDTTTIFAPKDKSYDVSGNGFDGFIVTVASNSSN
jgi:D-alanyl-D-alanine carboxypeptidase